MFGQVNLPVRWGEQGSQSSTKKQLQCSAVGIKPLGGLNFQAEKPQEGRWAELELELYTKMAVECKGENGDVTLPYCPIVETHWEEGCNNQNTGTNDPTLNEMGEGEKETDIYKFCPNINFGHF